MAGTSAVFIGETSLLIRCVEAFRAAGHEVVAIASRNAAILAWCEREGLPAIAISASEAILSAPPFDYLFSIGHLEVLPEPVTSRARKLAINFHDGPLPRYAGLHATSWALLSQEAMHGVTWHEMTATVDAGHIVQQALFPVAPDETALSLNAKCYEAGLSSFQSMLAELQRGELTLSEQRGERSYFGRDRRPRALATLDFMRPASEVCTVVRALDFGQYPNPLGMPKVDLGDRVLLVRSARVRSAATNAAPGTVIAVEGDSMEVATGEGTVLLEGCCDLQGRAGAHGIAPGQVLPITDDMVLEALIARAPQYGPAERFWTPRLHELSPVELPYPRVTSVPATIVAREFARMPLGVASSGARTVAAFFAWLSALTGQERVSGWYSDAALVRQATGLESWLPPWVPLTLVTLPKHAAQDTVAVAEDLIASCRKVGPYPCDLPLRLGDKVPATARVSRIGLSLVGAGMTDAMDLLLATSAFGPELELVGDRSVFSEDTLRTMAQQLAWYLREFETAQGAVADVPLLPPAEADLLARLNATAMEVDGTICVHDAIAAQAARTPDREAVRCQGESLTYRELDARATALARRLRARGIGAESVVGLCMERSIGLVVALIGILKSGAAYLPLDPGYPRERLAFMVRDSATPLVISDRASAQVLSLPAAQTLVFDDAAAAAPPDSDEPLPHVSTRSPAYVIYTSGSTGQPKGVVVSHRNVMNFFAGLGERVPHEPPGRWLAVTSLSFDISVLELCWTLSTGFTVVVHSDTARAPARPCCFSLFYFASDDSGSSNQDRYRLLLDGAKFADRNGFDAIWTPERHFHAFGGLYPNPAVTSAAIAAVTSRLKIRAGSCVLPLHHPIRVAEDWAFVDNLSNGRVGISFASGWQPNDFVIAPGAFADRKTEMIVNIDVVRRLWRGERVAFPGPLGKPVEVTTLPRPVQKELPVWVTAAGNPETFEQAGEIGCHLLTHLLGQRIEDVAEKLKLYRAARRRAGHPGEGHVTLMLHTFVGDDDDAVRATVRGPMKSYLRSSLDLIKQAAWTFPTFVQRAAQQGRSPVEIMESAPLSEDELDALLEHAFARYYGTSALFGTPQRCLDLVKRLQDAGVDEIACLVDFGVETDTVLEHLKDLKQLMDAAQALPGSQRSVSVAEALSQEAITHLQCTPSMASLLVADASGRAGLSRLSAMLVGGEALPVKLAQELRALVPGDLLNMYGPTETTVWSSTHKVDTVGNFVPLGEPMANTWLSIRTPSGQECPALVAGELFIGGDGVATGYWQRPDLDEQRFAGDAHEPRQRCYRTGDRVRRHADGAIEFLGRLDDQVKVRGHRIELGEIEAALLRQPGVRQAVVVAREDFSEDRRLVAYVVPTPGATPDATRIRDALAELLPPVMVPSAVVSLAALPMTPNGKVDRRALPAPTARLSLRPAALPQSPFQKVVASIWQDVLGLPQVNTTDNFFDLGGHSLLIVQVQRRLREATGVEVPITDMFRLPTIDALAAHLDGDAANSVVDEGLARADARRRMRSRGAAQPAASA